MITDGSFMYHGNRLGVKWVTTYMEWITNEYQRIGDASHTSHQYVIYESE